jgi:PAS domain S-box-containing protein
VWSKKTNSVKSAASRSGPKAHAQTPASGFKVDLNTNATGQRLSSDETLEIDRRQTTQAVQAAPLHMFFLACAAVTIAVLPEVNLSQSERLFWYVVGFLPVALHGIAWVLSLRGTDQRSVMRWIEAGGLFEGLAWSIPMSLFLGSGSSSSQTIIIGVSLAVAGVGALAMLRAPIGAVILTCLVVGAASRAILVHIENAGFAPSILCAIYGFVLVGIVISMHWEFLRGTRAELEVLRQRQVIALLLNDFEQGTSDWLWETDRDGRITYCSQRFAEALHRSEDDIIGATIESLVSPDQDQGGWATFNSALARQDAIPAQVLSLHIGGKQLHWQMTARPLLNEASRFIGYRGVGRDITEKWDSEEAVREAKDTAERANIAKSQFLSIVGHEIRTPLNAIVGFSELLMSPQGEAMAVKAKRDFLQTILESAHQLQGLINDVLDTTRIEKGTLRLNEQEVDVAEVAEIAAKQCRDQAEKAGVTVVLRLFEDVRITGDQARLKQIITNLLSNAVKFSPSGSVVNAEFSRGQANEFIFEVKDAGIGIKTEDVDRVFEPFVQADEGLTRRFGGLGLGLALARKIARLHGGDISLSSAPGAGTVARLTLPPSRVIWPSARQSGQSRIAAA